MWLSLCRCLVELQRADSWNHSRNTVKRLGQCYSANIKGLRCKCYTHINTRTRSTRQCFSRWRVFVDTHTPTVSDSVMHSSQFGPRNSTVAVVWCWPVVGGVCGSWCLIWSFNRLNAWYEYYAFYLFKDLFWYVYIYIFIYSENPLQSGVRASRCPRGAVPFIQCHLLEWWSHTWP